ncbi:MAG TPA: hypothetical protein VJB16_03470, partial [archaeon]|nr:hypothetical protein [archaeon]
MALVALGLAMQGSPIAWAQLETADPALHAAVEALVAHDPDIAGNPELAELCREVAEAAMVDPAERAAVTREVIALHQEGVDLNTVVPPEVREAAREQFEKIQGQMREQLESLRASDPGAAREMELMMREGEQCMRAFESGEPYTPSPDMVEHAREMFGSWKEDMLAQGASPEYVARAESEFTRWSSGEAMEMMGPGPEMMGPGGEMPSLEQMETMVASGQMTPEQLEMAKNYMEQGGMEHFGPGPMEGFGPGPMEAFGPNPMEAFEQFAANAGEYVSPEQMEQYREMAEQYQTEFENQNYDNTQYQNFEQQNPQPGAEVLVAIHDHTGPLGSPD